MSKICNKCLNNKSLSEFGNDKRNKDGKQGRCYSCCNDVRNMKYLKCNHYRDKERKRQKKYSKSSLERAKKHIKNLSDFYIIKELKRGTNLKTEDIKKYPEMIETKRQIIKNKRLCRV
jgi:hypothetical protein